MMKRKLSLWPLAFLLITLVLTACGDPTATTVPAPTTRAATTVPATTIAATTTAATTAPATTVVATTNAPATTIATTTAPVTTVAATTAALTTSAATTAAPKPGAVSFPLTITDDAKRTVKFDKAPARIVSLAPSNTEIVYALGLGERLVGVDQFSNYPAEAKSKEQVGGYNNTNIERVVALSPDLVLASSITSKQLITNLESKGLTLVIFAPATLAGVSADMTLLAQIANVPGQGEAVVADFQKKLDDIAAKTKAIAARPRVFYELDPTLFTVGPGSFIDDMIQKAGGQNIVTDAANPYPQLNQEAVINKDPEVILLGDDSGGTDSPDKILSRPGWSNISAVKTKRIVAVNADLVNRPGPRAVLGVEAIAKALYPDLFR